MIKYGDEGEQVKVLQQRLTQWGFPLTVDGKFGTKTKSAVKGFQRAMGLYVDAIVGPKTQSALNQSIISITHFKKEEFKCHCEKYCKGYPDTDDKYGGIDYALLIMLERIRAAAGNKPCRINSGYRCSKYNAIIGGASNSQHIYGHAADIRIDGASVSTVNKLADRLNPYGGVGKAATYTHVDTRGYKARWTY